MNDPKDIPIDFHEMLAWLMGHKARNNLSWSVLAQQSGIPQGSLSSISSPTWKGNKQQRANELYQFRQKVESQAARTRFMLDEMKFVETPTARRIQFLLDVAQGGPRGGRITVAAMGPGTGKTMTAQHYKASMGGTVWIATMRQSTSSVAGMIRQVMSAMALSSKTGWTQQMSAHIADHVRGRDGLLIVDEANHLGWEAHEELRGLHDATGVGIALLGNEELMMRIKGNKDRHAYARLSSRIANYHIQDLPSEGDITAYLDAMKIDDGVMRRPLIDVGLSVSHGGLREVQMILESANMLAIGDESEISPKYIEQAMSMRATQTMRRAA